MWPPLLRLRPAVLPISARCPSPRRGALLRLRPFYAAAPPRSAPPVTAHRAPPLRPWYGATTATVCDRRRRENRGSGISMPSSPSLSLSASATAPILLAGSSGGAPDPPRWIQRAEKHYRRCPRVRRRWREEAYATRRRAGGGGGRAS
jgi:hypothetical protein